MTDEKTLSLFDPAETALPTVQELVEEAIAAVSGVLAEGRPCIVGWSGGKDSSAAANIVLVAAKRCKQAGMKPLVWITNSNTLIENPEITELCQKEMRKMVDYGRRNGFKVIAQSVSPNLLSTFQVKVLTGRALPSFPNGNSDCSQDLKVTPQRRARKEIARQLNARGLKESVNMVGTRFEESERRALMMKARGERADRPVINKSGELVMSPIAMWQTMDVFEYLGLIASGLAEGYSDMAEVLRVYAHSGGSSCAVVAFDALEGGEKKRRGGCGARTGCWSCQMVEDRSLKTLIEFDARYAYARPLMRLSELIRRTRYDWNLRNWVGRTVRKGWIAIEPDTYSPAFIRQLTRYMLQCDHDERYRAREAGEAPRFEILSTEMKVAVDFLQNLQGIAVPHQLWADVRDIEQRGIRYDIPDAPNVQATAKPEPRFVHVGDDWEQGVDWKTRGLRDVYREAMTELAPCHPGLKDMGDGHHVWDLYTEKGFSVDPEVGEFIANEMQDDILKAHDEWLHRPCGITTGFKFYLGLGTPTLDHSQVAMYDEIARRTEWKFAQGFGPSTDGQEIYKKAVRFAEMDASGRAAWSHKATDAGSQMDLVDDEESFVEHLLGM